MRVQINGFIRMNAGRILILASLLFAALGVCGSPALAQGHSSGKTHISDTGFNAGSSVNFSGQVKAKAKPKEEPAKKKTTKSSKSNSTNTTSSPATTKSSVKKSTPVSKPVTKPASKPATNTTVRRANPTPAVSKPTKNTSSSTFKQSVSKPSVTRIEAGATRNAHESSTTTTNSRGRRDPVVEYPESNTRSNNRRNSISTEFESNTQSDRYRINRLEDLEDLEQNGCTLVVKSTPVGASVYHNETYLGRTPLNYSGLSSGKSTIRLELENYKTVSLAMVLTFDRVNRVSFNLEPTQDAKASLTVRSDPTGAWLTFDGREQGETPVTLFDLEPGRHNIVLKKTGHFDVEQNIDLAVGEQRSIEVYLPLINITLPPASVQVTSSPSGAEIFLNGSRAGLTPLTLDDLAPGKAVFGARMEGYENNRRSLKVESEEHYTVHFDMKELTGKLYVETAPVGASISVDGSPVGSTSSTGLKLENVAIGTHLIVATLDGYLAMEQMVSVQAGETSTVRMELQRIDTLPYSPKEFGMLSVTSSPTGAEVYLDYQTTGRYTPAQFYRLQPGRHLVSAYIEGIGWDEQYVLVRANMEARAHLTLGNRPYVVGGYGGFGGTSSAYNSYGHDVYDNTWQSLSRYLIDFDHTFDQGGNEGFNDMLALADGSLLLVGYQEEMGQRDAWLLKVDPYGDREWSKTYEARGWDQFSAIAQTTDFGFILAGYTSPDSSSEADAWLIKCDRNGDVIWSRTYGGGKWDSAADVVQTIDGNFLFAGETWSEGHGLSDGWLVKVNEEGYVEWSRRFGGKAEDHFTSIAITEKDVIFLAGSLTDASGFHRDGWLMKLSAKGKEVFSRTFGGGSNDGFSNLLLSDDGGMLLAGYTESEGIMERNAYLVRLNRNGEESWSRTYGEYNAAIAYDLLELKDGYMLCGSTLTDATSLNPHESGWIIRTDFRGETNWYREFTDESNTLLRASAALNNGHVFHAGSIHYQTGESNGWLLKLVPEEGSASEDDVLITPTGLMLRLVDHFLFR